MIDVPLIHSDKHFRETLKMVIPQMSCNWWSTESWLWIYYVLCFACYDSHLLFRSRDGRWERVNLVLALRIRGVFRRDQWLQLVCWYLEICSTSVVNSDMWRNRLMPPCTNWWPSIKGLSGPGLATQDDLVWHYPEVAGNIIICCKICLHLSRY